MQFIETQRERYTDEGKPPIEWERYLEIAPVVAGLDLEEREAVLGERGLDGATWTRAEKYWLLTLALDVHKGRIDRTGAYGRACAAAKAQPEQASAPAVETPRPAAEAPAPPESPPAAPAQAAEALPTFLRAEPPKVAVPAAVAVPPPAVVVAPAAAPKFDATCDVVPAFRPPALPFGRTPAPEHAARLATPSPAPRRVPADRLGATVLADEQPAKPTLPFSADRARTDSAPRLPALTVEQHAMLSAELAANHDPGARAAILARYGVEGPAALIALGGHWQQRLQSPLRQNSCHPV